MIIFFVFAISGYIFFKYLWPLLRNNDPKNRPVELYQFYDKHPKLLVLTIILALFGIGVLLNEVFSIIIGFIFVQCPRDEGILELFCWIKINLGLG